MEVIKIIVKTNSPKSEILNFDEDKQVYRVNIKAQPEKGKANLEIIKLFSKKFKKTVTILKGKTSKEKLLKLE